MIILLLALILDWYVGDPDVIWRRIPHPVVWMGKPIEWIESKLNAAELDGVRARQKGVFAIVGLILIAGYAGVLLQWLLEPLGLVGTIIEVVLVGVFIAQKSMIDHVNRVIVALRNDDIDASRDAVSQIVGRDTGNLNRSQICRAAIESLAENFADGVVAPAMWFGILGLPGLLIYKMVNTADSMIGHKSDRYRDFGRAAALTDDFANWPAARFSAGLVALAAAVKFGWNNGQRAMDVAMRDSGLHRSPNAGWPEAAFSGALDIALGGPRHYGAEEVRETSLNSGRRSRLNLVDLQRALMLFKTTCLVLWAIVALIIVLF